MPKRQTHKGERSIVEVATLRESTVTREGMDTDFQFKRTHKTCHHSENHMLAVGKAIRVTRADSRADCPKVGPCFSHCILSGIYGAYKNSIPTFNQFADCRHF